MDLSWATSSSLVFRLLDDLDGELKQRAIERDIGDARGFFAQLVQVGELQPGVLPIAARGRAAQGQRHKDSYECSVSRFIDVVS